MASTDAHSQPSALSWLEEIKEQLTSYASAAAKKGDSGNRNPREEEDEARARNAALSTVADKIGVSFRGRIFQRMYFEAKFVRRATLVHQFFALVFSTSQEKGNPWSEIRNALEIELTRVSGKSSLQICCVGGGPGNDAAGFLAADEDFIHFARSRKMPNNTNNALHDKSGISNSRALASAEAAFKIATERARAHSERAQKVFAKYGGTLMPADIEKVKCAEASAAAYAKAAQLAEAEAVELRQMQQHCIAEHAPKADSTNINKEVPPLEITLLDIEPQWRAYTGTLNRFMETRGASVSFALCDVCNGLPQPHTRRTDAQVDSSFSERIAENAPIHLEGLALDNGRAAVHLAAADLILLCYVAHETSFMARQSGWAFYHTLAISAKPGAVFLFMDVGGGRSADAFSEIKAAMTSPGSVEALSMPVNAAALLRSEVMVLYKKRD